MVILDDRIYSKAPTSSATFTSHLSNEVEELLYFIWDEFPHHEEDPLSANYLNEESVPHGDVNDQVDSCVMYEVTVKEDETFSPPIGEFLGDKWLEAIAIEIQQRRLSWVGAW